MRLPSFSLVPKNDASLLLINAGMAPLKPYFTGKETPPSVRATTCQKCIRTPDIEQVGKTARHGTFFEMLGNFSFGDYFKRDAIHWAWEFSTEVMGLPADRIWITVYLDDDEAYDIWTKEIGVPAERVVRMGKEDNFWEHGTGPCGPCSELHFDRGEEFGCGKPGCKIGCDCDRFMEFWNLVFTQFDKDADGNYNPLPNPNIDTGMGLERLAVLMQGVNNLFEVDTIRNIMAKVSEITGAKYGDSEKSDVSLRIITDHIRSTTFMISDGVLPSNEGRGYVLRRLLRRAARHGRLLGVDGPFLAQVVETVVAESGGAYPELVSNEAYIKKVVGIEEERFGETIDAGLTILQGYMDELKKQGETQLDGKSAFKLYDTYGFPLDLTLEILDEHNMSVDQDVFDAEMKKQREIARAARAGSDETAWTKDSSISLDDDVQSAFIGYDELTCQGKILAMVKDGELCSSLSEGEVGFVICDQTVFYAQSGGQVGDVGAMENQTGDADVTSTVKLLGRSAHGVTVKKGALHLGDEVTLSVNKGVRRAVTRNHSATHLLQKALQLVLGDHVKQAGSFVSGEHLRFDFTHFEPVTKEQLLKVEAIVNEKILAALPIKKETMPIEEAKKLGAMALFGEKYGDMVRVVSMGDFSVEFCGGCHLDNTSEAGLFKILSEGGVAAGVRRIEAVTGAGVLDYIRQKEQVIDNAAAVIKAAPAKMVERIRFLLEENKNAIRELQTLRQKLSRGAIGDMLTSMKEVKGVQLLCAQMNDLDVSGLREMGDSLKAKVDCAVFVLATCQEEKINFVAMATPQAVKKGAHAGNIIREITKIAGGSGGGKPDSAQGGGKLKEKIDDALAKVDDILLEQIKD